jgi:hypothetical protein
LRLVRRGDDFEILFDDEQLMGSWAYRSEEALATLTFARLRGIEPQILIGGVGNTSAVVSHTWPPFRPSMRNEINFHH